ncbi:MAG: hypothetical protein LBU14_00085 [Candidatus Peribacteria bacterium]|nr:hypothetical protein [Candidatus Peribacteria bacterium]
MFVNFCKWSFDLIIKSSIDISRVCPHLKKSSHQKYSFSKLYFISVLSIQKLSLHSTDLSAPFLDVK